MVMDFPGKVRIVLFGRLENNLEGGSISKYPPRKSRPGGRACLGPICELVSGEVHLAERPLADQSAERIVPN